MGGYRKQCPTCRRTFTHPPAFTIHRKSCGNEGGAPTPRSRPAAPRSPRSQPVNPLSFPAKPPPATKRQRQLAAQEELSISLEMEQAAYARDLEALSPKPRARMPAQEVTEMVLDGPSDDDAEMARQLQRELNGFRGRSPRRQSFIQPSAHPQAKPRWDNEPAATTLVGRNVCRRTGGQMVTTGTVTQRALRNERLKYQVTYTDGRIEELEFEQLRPLLEPTGKNVSARFMSMPGDDPSADAEPEEPKEIRVGEDFQCTAIPTMLTTPPAGDELATVGNLVWDPTSVTPAALSSYLSATADEPPQSGDDAAGGTPPSSLAVETRRNEAAASEHLLHHLHSHAYDVAAASSSARSVKRVNGPPRLIEPMRRVFEDAVEKHGKDFRLISQIMNSAARKSVKKADDKRTAEVTEVLDGIVSKIVAGDAPADAAGGDDEDEDAAEEEAESEAEAEPSAPEQERQPGELRIGDVVDVDRKTATGDGGRATIVDADSEGLFVVKYVVGTKEKRHLPAAALSLFPAEGAAHGEGGEADSTVDNEKAGSEKTPDGSEESDPDEEAPTPAPGGSWTTEEDDKLIALIKQHGEVDWPERANDLGTGRSAKACQTRYRNHLRNKPRETKTADYGFTGEPVEPISVAELTLWYYTVWKMTPQHKAWHERWSNRNNSECEVCDRAGRLLCCSDCPASYHPRCCNPKYESWDAAMAEVGEKGVWQCQNCRPGPRLTRAQIMQASAASNPLSLQPRPESLAAETSRQPPSSSAASAAGRIPRSPPITPASVPVRPSVPPPPASGTSGGGTKRPSSTSSAALPPPKKRSPASVSSETTPLLSPRPEAAPKWSPEEDEWLLQSVAQNGIGNWALKAEEHANPGLRSASSVGHRWQKLVGLEPERAAEAVRLAEQRGRNHHMGASSISTAGASLAARSSSSSLSGVPSLSRPSSASLLIGAAAAAAAVTNAAASRTQRPLSSGSGSLSPDRWPTDMDIEPPREQERMPGHAGTSISASKQEHPRTDAAMIMRKTLAPAAASSYPDPFRGGSGMAGAPVQKQPPNVHGIAGGDERNRLSLSTVTSALSNSGSAPASAGAVATDGLQLLLQLSNFH
jgi:hypothetical protein